MVSGQNGDYAAGPGWDYTTGFGSLNVAGTELVLDDFAPALAVIDFILSN
ncbi:MAG TPA: hypothetical protein VGH20_14655 [Myxococcales bacterium]